MDNLIWTQFIVDIDQFLINYFISVIINSDYKACFGMGWDSETISISFTLSYVFINCLKKVFEKICDLAETWRGAEAQWLDECTESDSATLNMWEYNLMSGEQSQIQFGTIDPKSAIHCKGVFGIGDSNPVVEEYAKSFYRSLM